MRTVAMGIILGLSFGGPLHLQAQVNRRTSAPASTRAEARTTARSASTDQEKGAQKKEETELLLELRQLKQLVLDQSHELEAQREMLREQQHKMKELERHLEQSSAAASAGGAGAEEVARAEEVRLLEGQLEAVADSQKELGDRVAATQKDLAATKSSAEGKFRQLGNFRFSGDLRMRMEPFIQRGALGRVRYRVRARFNLQSNITDELFGGISLATGTLDDPVSTNQTLTGFFNRKQVGFDRYFMEYTPKAFNNHARFGVGKFAFPWIRTTLTFDTDMNPEGIYTRLNWDSKNSTFKGVSIVGFWLPIWD